MRSRIAVTTVNNAVARRGGAPGCVLHTDTGSQCRSRKLAFTGNRHDMAGSMGRVGAAGDNAAMESFIARLHNNVLNTRTWSTRDDLRIAIVTWIERTYHHRRQTALGPLTPIEYQTMMTPAATNAVKPHCHQSVHQPPRRDGRAIRHSYGAGYSPTPLSLQRRVQSGENSEDM